jgi:hypothetical protein
VWDDVDAFEGNRGGEHGRPNEKQEGGETQAGWGFPPGKPFVTGCPDRGTIHPVGGFGDAVESVEHGKKGNIRLTLGQRQGGCGQLPLGLA